LGELEIEYSNLIEEKNYLKQHWILEKEKIQSIRSIKSKIEHAKSDADIYEREGDLGKVAEIRYGTISSLEKRLKDETLLLSQIQTNKKMLKEEVDAEDIAEVVAKWTGIPLNKMLQSERSKLIRLEDELHKRIVGQEDAVAAVANAIRRSRAGLQDANRPIGSFIFMGTTGVGKTELARALAEFLFDDEHAMIRIDMSEYMEKFSVSRLIGAPPGYVGYEEGGQLTEAVRRKPYSVVLLDEIEKAHSDVFNVLLQVLDEGRLTDNQGRTVNFKNTIVIMTSNLGSQIIHEHLEKINEENMQQIMGNLRMLLSDLLKKTIHPEFLNRIDDIILFRPLTQKELRQIVDIQIEKVKRMLEEKNIGIELTDDAKDWLAELGFDIAYGARPLKRIIQRYLINPLSQELLLGNFVSGETLFVDQGEKGNLDFSKRAT